MVEQLTGLDNTEPIFSKAEVYSATLKYFNNDDLATNVWVDKYCLKNLQGNYLELTPDDMHKRLAKEFARIELKYSNPLSCEEIYILLRNFTYVIPGGSILYGLGNSHSISSLGNCFVIGNNSDSYGGICTTDQEQAQLMKRRAGVGHDLSQLRPSKSSVSNAAGTSTGVISFMDRYSHTTREVAQDGRRGALMLTLDINHPDIEQFITSKDDLSKITGANISVKITDEFMKAVEEDKEYILSFPTDVKDIQILTVLNKPLEEPKEKYKWEFLKTHPIQTVKIKAKPLWDKLIHQAYTSAEPGCLFWSKIQKESIPSCYGKDWEETSTNP